MGLTTGHLVTQPVDISGVYTNFIN